MPAVLMVLGRDAARAGARLDARALAASARVREPRGQRAVEMPLQERFVMAWSEP